MAQSEPFKTSPGALKQLEQLPAPAFDNFQKASKEDLAEHVQELRLWCGLVVMFLKELDTRIDVVASWQMVQDASQNRSEETSSLVDDNR